MATGETGTNVRSNNNSNNNNTSNNNNNNNKQTDRTIPNNKPDIIIRDNENLRRQKCDRKRSRQDSKI